MNYYGSNYFLKNHVSEMVILIIEPPREHYYSDDVHVSNCHVLQAWKNTVGNVISGLALGELYNMYAGALLPSNQQAGTLSVVCGCVLWIYKMILSSMCMMCEALIIDETKVPSLDVHSNVAEATLALHVTTPQGLSYLSKYILNLSETKVLTRI